MTTNNNDEYRVVRKCNTMPEANIIMSLLAANGVECFISDTSFANLFPANPVNREKLEIRVRPEDEQTAIEVLNAKFDEKDLEQ